MCGIAGVIGNASASDQVALMCETLAHRGPDASGVVRLPGGSALGHRRLSIIDTDARSNQPFVRDGLSLVYNGEIYNFAEIRTELAESVRFTTTSDTEIVLEAWRRWGVDALRRFRGMYSFAIHDARLGRTVVVRDPFGIKPLFYLELGGGGVAFASELKALVAAFRSQLQPDLSAVLSSLVWVWIPEEYCVWRPVRKLQPGSMLTIDAQGRCEESRYWSFGELTGVHPDLQGEEPAVETLDRVLQESVKAHLVADVPVNAFLSGGLDSSLLVAMARRHLDGLDSYCLRFDSEAKRHEAMADDASYAQRVARELDVKLHMVDARPDMSTLLAHIIGVLDEPIGDSAAIASFLICDAARQNGVKVLLSGMGADELFGGYRKHRACLLAARYRRVPAALRRIVDASVRRLPAAGSAGGLRTFRWAKRFVSFASLPEADAFMRSYSYCGPEDLDRLAGDDARGVYTDLSAMHRRTFEASGTDRDPVNRMCLTDVQRFMVSLNEAYTDRASMAASTEVRVPFIDREVVHTAFRIPGSLKIRGGTSKYVLRKVAERWLPHDVIYRPKSSFTLPLRAWVRRDLADTVQDYVVSPSGLSGRGWLQQAELRRLVDDDRSGRSDNAQLIWQLMSVEQWFRNHGL